MAFKPDNVEEVTIVNSTKKKIDQIIIAPLDKSVTIMYINGTEDVDGNFIPIQRKTVIVSGDQYDVLISGESDLYGYIQKSAWDIVASVEGVTGVIV